MIHLFAGWNNRRGTCTISLWFLCKTQVLGCIDFFFSIKYSEKEKQCSGTRLSCTSANSITDVWHSNYFGNLLRKRPVMAELRPHGLFRQSLASRPLAASSNLCQCVSWEAGGGGVMSHCRHETLYFSFLSFHRGTEQIHKVDVWAVNRLRSFSTGLDLAARRTGNSGGQIGCLSTANSYWQTETNSHFYSHPQRNFQFLSSDLRVFGRWEENHRGSRKHV